MDDDVEADSHDDGDGDVVVDGAVKSVEN